MKARRNLSCAAACSSVPERRSRASDTPAREPLIEDDRGGGASSVGAVLDEGGAGYELASVGAMPPLPTDAPPLIVSDEKRRWAFCQLCRKLFCDARATYIIGGRVTRRRLRLACGGAVCLQILSCTLVR